VELTPAIYNAKVMHKRHFPAVNQFTYGVYYLAIPLSELDSPNVTDHLKVNKAGAMSFHTKDHGARNDSNLKVWVEDVLKQYGMDNLITNIMLVSMPRILGYVFNPVSFWMCYDAQGDLRAVLCEVNNTFGETHSYLCAHDDHRPILQDDIMTAQKLFHVSPFLKRKGHYTFRFADKPEKLGIWIDFYDAEGNKQLETALTGTLTPMTKSSLRKAFWTHPLVTFKAITLIHWQAVKIIAKKIRYISKPKQHDKRISSTKD